MIDLYNKAYADLTGAVLGTLAVQDIASHRPPKWNVRCQRCGVSYTELHDRLITYPVCRNASCGRRQAIAEGEKK